MPNLLGLRQTGELKNPSNGHIHKPLYHCRQVFFSVHNRHFSTCFHRNPNTRTPFYGPLNLCLRISEILFERLRSFLFFYR